MAEITAATVKELRDRTGLPMMDCKKALDECDGDSDAAVQWLRERGAQVFSKRSDRSTDFGRFGIIAGHDQSVAAMVELKCESAPVTQNEEFICVVIFVRIIKSVAGILLICFRTTQYIHIIV